MVLLISDSAEETIAIGKKFSTLLKPGMIVCLEGDLGSGKTTFLKGVLSSLINLSEEAIQSPTFVYMHLYEEGAFPVCHFDLYRLSGPSDFEALGFSDYLDEKHLCFIEWPSKILPLIPPEAVKITFDYLEPFKRQIEITMQRQAL